jgi:purine catabolism regulator
MTVNRLLSMSHLGLNLLAGEHGLSRAISYAHVCELEDPRLWLEGGELILTTGLAVPPRARAQVAYLQRLYEAKASAVGIAAGMSAPPLSASLLRRANELGFPVLTVAYEVPFIAISRVVVASTHRELERRLLRTLQIFDTLRYGAFVGDSASELLAMLEDLCGYELVLTSQHQTPLAGRFPLLSSIVSPPEIAAKPLIELPEIDGRRGYVLSFTVAEGETGRLWAIEKEPGSGLGTVVLQHVATVAAVQFQSLLHERAAHYVLAREVLVDILGEQVTPEVVRRRVLLSHLQPEEPMVLCAIKVCVGDAAANFLQGIERYLHDYLWDVGVPSLVARFREMLWVLINHRQSRSFDGYLGRYLASEGCRVAVSSGFFLGEEASSARYQARRGLLEAQRLRQDVYYCEDEGSLLASPSWLPRESFELKAISQLLASIGSDARGRELKETLRQYLASGHRVDVTCRVLGIHRHTLANRLRRLESIMGRSVLDPDDVVDLWRALRAEEILARMTDGSGSDAI